MAGRNIPIPPPPITSPITSQTWRDWFRDLYYRLSARNHQVLVGAGAINLDATYVALDSTDGGFAVTLDPPTVAGSWKFIEMTADGGNVTLALTNVVGGSASTTCTWNDVRDTLTLVSLDDKWRVIDEGGVTLT